MRLTECSTAIPFENFLRVELSLLFHLLIHSNEQRQYAEPYIFQTHLNICVYPLILRIRLRFEDVP
jgi:hypothetical protein